MIMSDGEAEIVVAPGVQSYHEALALMFEQAPSPIFLKDLDGRYLLANRRFRDAFGLTAAQILGRRDEEIFSADQARQFQDNDRLVLDAQRPRQLEERARQDQGERVNAVERFPIRDAGGSVVALGGIVTDITERERARLALEESEERFRLFADNGLTLAWMKDENGRFVYVSRSLEERSGVSAAQRLGKRTEEVMFPELAARMTVNDRAVLEADRPINVVEEIRFGESDPQVWYVHKFPFRDRRGDRFVGGVALDITARVALEQALRQQMDRFILPAFGARIGSHDRDLRRDTIHVSSGVAQMLGIGNEPVTWTPEQWREVIHPDDRAMNQATLQAHVDGHTPMVDMEYRVRHVNGHYRWVRSLGAALRDEGGQPSRVIGVLIDITEQKHAQEREMVQQRLTSAIAHVQHVFLEQNDVKHTFEVLLQALLSLTGSEFGFVGEMLHDETGAPYFRSHAVTDIAWDEPSRAYFAARDRNLEFRNLNSLFGDVLTTHRPVIANDPETDPRRCGLPPGHPPLSAFMGLPFSKGDEVLGMIGVANRPGGYDESLVGYLGPFLATCANIVAAIREREARRAAQAALREEELRFRQLVDLSPDAVLLHQDEKYVFANPAALRLLNMGSLDELRALHPFDLLEPAYRELARMRSRRVIEEDVFAPMTEMRIHTESGGARDIETVASRVTYMGRPALQAVWRDITERKRAHERETRSRRLESLGTLAGGVAHDFNNILTAIRINTELVQDELPAHSNARQYLDQVKLAGERATALVRQILNFSRASTEKREPVSLTSVVREVLGMVRATVPAMIDLKAQLPEDALQVSANASQIHQVVLNLIINAIHAIGRKAGHIDVSIDVCTDEPAGEPGTSPVRQVRLRVADDGSGMDEHTLERIFDPFFTTKAPGQGVGLGLSVVHEIVRTHEGRIEVASRPGEGTTFDLYFPVTQAAEAQVAEEVKRLPGDGLRVLFLDDDPLVNFACERMLSKAGFRVTAMLDPVKALEAFRERPAQFDALVVDLAMPGMNGLDFARATRACRGDIPIVLASGYFEPADEYDAAKLGITGLLNKPYDIQRLARMLAGCST